MPKIGRDKLQIPTKKPAILLAFYLGEKLQKHLGSEAPPLKWCSVAALFAIQGQHADLHSKVYPDWLKDSFIKQKKLTLYSLEWCHRKFEKFITKYENQAMTTALYSAMDNYFKMIQGDRIDSQHLLKTSKQYEWSCNFTDDTLTKAANKVQLLHERFEAFKKTEEGNFWGEV